MTFTFTGRKFEATDALRDYAEKKVGKIDKLFRTESDASVTFSAERGRYTVEVTIRNNGMFYRVTETTSDMYASIDSACAALVRQVRKNKTRLEKHLREGAFERSSSPEVMPEEDEETPEYKIIRSKHFAIKPMSPEEAAMQMDLLGHSFFAFRNQNEDGAFAVVYKRNDGGYGMISDEQGE